MNRIVDWKKIERGLQQYKVIMQLYQCSDNVENDKLLHSKYKIFYGMYAAKKSEEFYSSYFKLLKNAKENGGVDFSSILLELKRVSNKNEISFTSKLLATANPDLPVWDVRVRQIINEIGNINLKATYKTIDECVVAYKTMLGWYDDFLKTNQAKQLISEFDCHFPREGISTIKKIDFVFWQSKME